MEFKGTKGPWIEGVDPDSDCVAVYSSDGLLNRGFPVCLIYPQEEPSQEDIANTQLIVAAPELLAACQEFVRKCECGEAKSTRSYNQMKKAISIALGKEQ